MDIQGIATQLIGYLGNNPDLIQQFVAHPYSTTAKATGSDERISQTDMSKIVTQVAAQATNQNLGKSQTADIAATLLSQNGGSVHALTSALFGGAPKASSSSKAGATSLADIAVKSLVGGVAARGMASLITGAMGAATKKK